MNKAELIAEIALVTHASKAAVTLVLDGLAAVAEHNLSVHGEFAIPGVGKLEAVRKGARTGRNPRTGATIEIRAKTAIKFKATKALKDALN